MVHALATHFDQGVWQSIVICSDDGPLKSDLESGGVQVRPVNLATKWRAVASIPALAREIRLANPALIHLHGQFAGFAGGIACRLARHSRIVYTARFPSFMTDGGFLRRQRNAFVERVSCQCAQAVVRVSECDRKEYVRRRLLSEHKSMVIYNGVAVEDFPLDATRQPWIEERNALQGGPVIGFVGRLADQKGVEVLLRALPNVLQRYPRCALLVAGNGPMMQGLNNLAGELGIQQSVRFLGWCHDVPTMLAGLDLLVIPSLYEPFGNIALEGMAAATPIVASRVGGLQETVLDGVTGRLVAPNDPLALARAIAEVLADPQKARRMGSAGRERVQRDFTIAAMLARYEALYRSVLIDSWPSGKLETGRDQRQASGGEPK
jgi:glycosyltransferase involved in cell wall biosynthesis